MMTRVEEVIQVKPYIKEEHSELANEIYDKLISCESRDVFRDIVLVGMELLNEKEYDFLFQNVVVDIVWNERKPFAA